MPKGVPMPPAVKARLAAAKAAARKKGPDWAAAAAAVAQRVADGSPLIRPPALGHTVSGVWLLDTRAAGMRSLGMPGDPDDGNCAWVRLRRLPAAALAAMRLHLPHRLIHVEYFNGSTRLTRVDVVFHADHAVNVVREAVSLDPAEYRPWLAKNAAGVTEAVTQHEPPVGSRVTNGRVVPIAVAATVTERECGKLTCRCDDGSMWYPWDEPARRTVIDIPPDLRRAAVARVEDLFARFGFGGQPEEGGGA